MYKNELTVELLTENGNKITEFHKDGLTYIEGRKGSKYSIRVKNHSSSKIKAIISVDGLDIITGKRAKPDSGGYVINAFDEIKLQGWRISNEQIREFFFSSAKDSYNAKTGNDTNNLGVIGVLAYKEYIPPLSYNSYWYRTFDNNQYSPVIKGLAVGAMYNSTSTSVGTGMGEIKNSKVTEVHATWEKVPFSAVDIFYKSRKELEAMGITIAPIKDRPMPSSFEGYCKQV